MNLSIVLTDFLEKQGILKTYRFIPTNEWNRVVVDRIDDIDSDVKGNTDQDIPFPVCHCGITPLFVSGFGCSQQAFFGFRGRVP